MLSWFIGRRLESFEQNFGYDASYLKEILAHSPRAAIKFAQATSLGDFERGLPTDALYAARLVAIVSEDCGPCSQLTVTMAERAGVDPELIRKLVAGRFETLPNPVRDTALFTLATLKRSPEADTLRQRVIEHFGQLGLISIAFAITAARMYPTVKYALGYGHECQRLNIGGHTVTPAAALRVAGTGGTEQAIAAARGTRPDQPPHAQAPARIPA